MTHEHFIIFYLTVINEGFSTRIGLAACTIEWYFSTAIYCITSSFYCSSPINFFANWLGHFTKTHTISATNYRILALIVTESLKIISSLCDITRKSIGDIKFTTE
jgi:hypothetical protein